MQQRNAMPVLVSGVHFRVVYELPSHWSPPPDQQGLQNGASLNEELLVPPRTKATALLRTLQADERGCLSRSSVLAAWTLIADVLLMSVSKGKRSFRLWLFTS